MLDKPVSGHHNHSLRLHFFPPSPTTAPRLIKTRVVLSPTAVAPNTVGQKNHFLGQCDCACK
jgi:hypothetical protein